MFKKNRIEAKKLSLFDRIRLKMMMPNLEKYKRKYSDEIKPDEEYILVKQSEYDLMKKITERQDNYIEQIKINNKEIQKQQDEISDLSISIEFVLEQLKIKETERRKSAGKVGGLTASLNKEKEKTEQLIESNINLENTIELKNNEIKLKELEIKEKETEIKILKNLGKKKQIGDYKKLQEIRKDIDNRKGIRGVNYD